MSVTNFSGKGADSSSTVTQLPSMIIVHTAVSDREEMTTVRRVIDTTTEKKMFYLHYLTATMKRSALKGLYSY